MRFEPWRTGDVARAKHSDVRSLVPVLGVLALVVAAAYGFVQSRAANESRQVAVDDIAQIELFQVRVELAWLHHDQITDALSRSVDNVAIEPEIPGYLAERDRLLGEVRRLARQGGDVGAAAESVLELHAAAEIDSWPVDAAMLDLLHYESMPYEPTSGKLADRLAAYLDGVATSMIPRFVLGDALSIEMHDDQRTPPAWAADYVDQTASIAIETPGWFGPARQSPMTNHVLVDPSGSGAVYRDVPSIVAAVESVEPSIQQVWDYDQWIVAGDFEAPAPLTIDELSDRVDRIAAAFEAGFVAGMAEERESIVRGAPGESAATIWFVLALSALSVAVLGLAGLVLRQSRRQRSLAQAAYVDGLTGAFNRRFLDEEIDGWCRRRVGHVAIAMVDLDRFKLVNDTWGHATGDAILTEASSRLAVAAAGVRQDDADAASAVARIGGDEFVVAWVGSQPFDVGTIERAVADIAGPVETLAGESVPLELSVGVATGPTPARLDDLMRAADLATYAHKASKQSGVPSAHPAPTD